MAIADMLIKKIESWLDQQEQHAEKLEKLAAELKSLRRSVVGSSAPDGAAAWIRALFTRSAVSPFGTGSASAGSGTAETTMSNKTMEHAKEISEKSMDLKKEIQRLMKLLVKEVEKEEQKAGACRDDAPEVSVVNGTAHSGVRRSDSEKDANVGPLQRTVQHVGGGAVALVVSVPELMLKAAELAKEKNVTEASQRLRDAAKHIKTNSEEMKKDLDEVRKAFEKFSKVNHFEKSSKEIRELQTLPLRHAATSMPTTSAETMMELHEKLKMLLLTQMIHLEMILKKTIETIERETKELIEFAKENCKDEATRRWLQENSESGEFLTLVRMFHYLKGFIDKKESSIHSKEVDIIFFAHGVTTYDPTETDREQTQEETKDDMISASCLLPVDTVRDVVLYSPWNCTIDTKVVCCIAMGDMKPQDRIFECRGNSCSVPSKDHQPTNLPNHWNSMKKAGDQQIPNIMLSPLGPEDGTSKILEHLDSILLERNRIVVPYIFPEQDGSLSSGVVPFSIVTLALSLVLIFSRFRATVHLAACLSDKSERKNAEQLKQQYAYTIDNTCMTVSPYTLCKSFDSVMNEHLKKLFG